MQILSFISLLVSVKSSQCSQNIHKVPRAMASVDYHASYAKFLVRDQLVRELDPNTNTGEPLDGTPFQGEPSEGVPPIPLLPSIPLNRHHLPSSHNDDFVLPPPNDGKTRESYKVCIVGAGMAGIYTAYLLDALGFSYDILESSDRAGGRVLTHRFSDVTHDYYDAGAMRFPDNAVMKRFVSSTPPHAQTFGNLNWRALQVFRFL